MEIKDIITKSIESHIASGYKYRLQDEAPSEVVDILKKTWTLPKGLNLDPDEVFQTVGGFCAYKEEMMLRQYADDFIYIFVEGIKKAAERYKAMLPMNLEELIEFCVIHECRHSQQIVGIRKAGFNPDNVFKVESKCYPYSHGPFEMDANMYAIEEINGMGKYKEDSTYPLKRILDENKETLEKLEME